MHGDGNSLIIIADQDMCMNLGVINHSLINDV